MLAYSLLATSASGGWTEPVSADGGSGSVSCSVSRVSYPWLFFVEAANVSSASLLARLQHKEDTLKQGRLIPLLTCFDPGSPHSSVA